MRDVGRVLDNLSKNCYPSPALHAISLSGDIQSDVTLPVSRTMTKEGY